MEELKLIDVALIFALVINGILIGLALYLKREEDFWKMMYNYSERQNNKLFEDNKELADKLKSEVDKVVAEMDADHKEACDRLKTANLIKDEQKAKADKLFSCLKCIVMRDLIKDSPEKASAIEIAKEYDLW